MQKNLSVQIDTIEMWADSKIQKHSASHVHPADAYAYEHSNK